MPIRADGPGVDPEIHRWESGVTWIAHPEEGMRRASSAVIVGDQAWIVEPIDASGLDEVLGDLGPVGGVVVLADYHRRDAAALADRHDVPVFVPRTIAGLTDDVDAPVEVFDDVLPGTTFEAIPLLDGFPWTEVALYDPERRTLVATEALVTNERLTRPGERLAVTPYVRLTPPVGPLRGLDVERVLVGHGAPVVDDATSALESAIANARRGALPAIATNLPYLLRAAAVALRE